MWLFLQVIGVALLITFLVFVYLLSMLTITDKLFPWYKPNFNAMHVMIFFCSTGMVGSLAIAFGMMYLLL